MGSRLAGRFAAGALILLVVGATATEAGAQAIQQRHSPLGHQSVAGGLIAPPAACPGADRAGAPVVAQEQAMLCLVDFARREMGLPSLAPVPALETSAAHKSADMLGC